MSAALQPRRGNVPQTSSVESVNAPFQPSFTVTVLMSFSSTVPPALPLPQSAPPPNTAAREPFMNSIQSRISLDGDWMFRFGDETPHAIAVPAPWESLRPELVDKAGTAIYEKSFTVPEHFSGRRIVLRFGAVDYFAGIPPRQAEWVYESGRNLAERLPRNQAAHLFHQGHLLPARHRCEPCARSILDGGSRSGRNRALADMN